MNKKYTNIYMLHLGKILSNYTIVGTSLLLLVMFAALLPVAYYVLAFLIAVCSIVFTLGMVFLANPQFLQSLFGGGEVVAVVSQYSVKAAPYLMGITIAAAVASVVLLLCQKEEKSTGRVVGSIVCAVFAIIFGVVTMIGGGK